MPEVHPCSWYGTGIPKREKPSRQLTEYSRNIKGCQEQVMGYSASHGQQHRDSFYLPSLEKDAVRL